MGFRPLISPWWEVKCKLLLTFWWASAGASLDQSQLPDCLIEQEWAVALSCSHCCWESADRAPVLQFLIADMLVARAAGGHSDHWRSRANNILASGKVVYKTLVNLLKRIKLSLWKHEHVSKEDPGGVIIIIWCKCFILHVTV